MKSHNQSGIAITSQNYDKTIFWSQSMVTDEINNKRRLFNVPSGGNLGTAYDATRARANTINNRVWR